MGFVASEQLDPLDYDFGDYGPKGTVPEPSTEQIYAFRKALADIAVDVLDAALKLETNREQRRGGRSRGPKKAVAVPSQTPPPAEPELSAGEQALQNAKIIATVMTDNATTVFESKTLQACADVCSNTPSFDELDALPWRLKQAFMFWLAGVFLSPEAWRPATSA